MLTARGEARHPTGVDLLLLNCSNLSWRPIFPYAFVQVSEVARRHGLVVARQDMLYVPDWQDRVRADLDRLRPRMVGIHLRQADTVDLSDYDGRQASIANPNFRQYFPVEATRRLIGMIRTYTDAPVVLGGFGFTAHAARLAELLEIDLGVAGCPDGFFARFEDVLQRRDLASVPNLIHFDGARHSFNPRSFYDPAEGLEYDDGVLAELFDFYGDKLHGDDPPTIAIEVSRGCPFQCYFCTEPEVKGRRLARRSLDVVEGEMRGLLRRGLRDFWFVCSEINLGGTGFASELAERVIRLNEDFPGRPIRWSGYALPTLKESELRFFRRAGYTGAINDILSLDDDNLKRARVPYRKQQALRYMKTMVDLRDRSAPAPHDPSSKFTANSPDRFERLVSMFLGNAHVSEKTIPRTLRALHESGLAEAYDEGYAIPSTRVFPAGGTAEFRGADTTVSIGPGGERPTDTAEPTFHFPPALQDRLGSRQAVIDYLDYVSSTFMSRAHRRAPKWRRFIEDQIGLPRMAALLDASGGSWRPGFSRRVAAARRGGPGAGADPGGEPLATLADGADGDQAEAVAAALLASLLEAHPDVLAPIVFRVGRDLFDGTDIVASEYQLTERLYDEFPTEDSYSSFRDRHGAGSIESIFIRSLETYANFTYSKKYADLTFDSSKEPS